VSNVLHTGMHFCNKKKIIDQTIPAALTTQHTPNYTPHSPISWINPLNAELNPICHLLALLGAHHILHVGRIRVNNLVILWQLQFMYLLS